MSLFGARSFDEFRSGDNFVCLMLGARQRLLCLGGIQHVNMGNLVPAQHRFYPTFDLLHFRRDGQHITPIIRSAAGSGGFSCLAFGLFRPEESAQVWANVCDQADDELRQQILNPLQAVAPTLAANDPFSLLGQRLLIQLAVNGDEARPPEQHLIRGLTVADRYLEEDLRPGTVRLSIDRPIDGALVDALELQSRQDLIVHFRFTAARRPLQGSYSFL